MKRFGQIIGVKPEKLADYKYHHANIWPEINAMIKECNIQNYSIYNFGDLLFSYMEYVGDDYDADMAKMAADPKDAGVVGFSYALSAAVRSEKRR